MRRLNAEIEKREEAGYKFTVGLDTRTKKVCERDKWTMY